MLLVIIYLVNLYIRPQDWMPFFYGWPVDYLIIIPALIYAFIKKSGDKKKLVNIPQYKLLGVLLIIIFLSNAVHGEFELGASEFTLFFKKICIFIMVLFLVNTTKRLKLVMFLMIAFSCLIAGQAIQQYLSGGAGLAGQDFYHSGKGVRTKWVGLWNGANIMALMLNIVVPFTLEFSFGPYSLFWRLLNMFLSACLMFGVYTTNSRGGFVTLLAILFAYPMFKLKKKKTAAILGVILAGIMFLYFAPQRVGEINTKEESAHLRTKLWSHGMEMFKENPLLGVGKGMFKENAGYNLVAHSNFMQNLGEIGGLGIFVWVGLIYFSFKSMYLIYRENVPPRTKEGGMKSISMALIVSLIGFNVCTLFITQEIDLFYLLLGLCAATFNVMNREVRQVEIKFSAKDRRNIIGIIAFMLLYYHIYTR